MIDLIQLQASMTEAQTQLRSLRESARQAQEHLTEAKAISKNVYEWAEGQLRIAEGLRERP